MSCRISKIVSFALFCASAGAFAGPCLADGAAKFVGSTTVNGPVPSDFGTYWNQITPERQCTWQTVEKTHGTFDFSECDIPYNWAKENKAIFKFHALLWASGNPSWLRDLSADETKEAIIAWFDAVAERYPDLEYINVVSEARRNHSQIGTNNKIIEALGGDNEDYKFITTAFKMARERWPQAILIYNDYNTIQWERNDGIDLINTIKNNGAPVDAYGLESNDLIVMGTGPMKCYGPDLLKSALQEIYEKTETPLLISEYNISTEDDSTQKQCFSEHIPVFMETEYVMGVTLWGYLYNLSLLQCITNPGISCCGIIRDGKDRPAMTWFKEYFHFQGDSTAKDTTIADSTISIDGGLHLQANTLQAYDVFDLNGVRLGHLRAYTIEEAVSILKNTSDIKVQGIYMLRSVKNGTVKQVRIAQAK